MKDVLHISRSNVVAGEIVDDILPRVGDAEAIKYFRENGGRQIGAVCLLREDGSKAYFVSMEPNPTVEQAGASL